MKILTRLLTRNLRKVPLLYINFDMQKFRKDGTKGSCDCVLHPVLAKDKHIIEIMNGLCDYVRENYDMEKLI